MMHCKPFNEFVISYPMYGLANRLLCLSSCWCLAKKNKRPFSVSWIPSYDFNSKLNDIFNYDFLENVLQGELIKCCGSINNEKISEFFKHLEPKISEKEIIFKYLVKYNNFEQTIGVHVRKGDYNTKNIFDHLYVRAMKYVLKLNPNANFFLATDEPENCCFENQFSEKIIFTPKKHLDRTLEGIREAIIDMWLLSYTKLILAGVGTFGICSSKIRNTNLFNVIDPNGLVLNPKYHYRLKEYENVHLNLSALRKYLCPTKIL